MSEAAVADRGPGAMGEAAVPAVEAEVGIIQEAVALMAVSAIDGSRRERLPLRLIAPHKGHRGGQHPQDERVRELAIKDVIVEDEAPKEERHRTVYLRMRARERRRQMRENIKQYPKRKLIEKERTRARKLRKKLREIAAEQAAKEHDQARL